MHYEPWEEYKCNIEQYRMLKRCSDKKVLTEWNNWREANPDEEIFLQGADLSSFWLIKADLHGANCQQANCQEANFERANCREAIFDVANCQKANFWSANCQKADFEDANCQRANFFQADCQNASFSEANCQKADFEDANCQETKFWQANCQETKFWQANCQEAKFKKANCQEAIFGSANCQEANFWQANCQEAYFYMANCQEAYFYMANCQEAKFWNANCQEAVFNRTDFQGAKIDGANLKHASFQNVILNHETRIVDCKIDDQTDFTNTSLSSVIIEPGKRAKLEQNIRRLGWEKWYRDKMEGKKPAHRFLNFLLVRLARFFWYLSNYGYSTTRVLGWFVGFVVYFALFYTYFPCMLEIKGASLPTFPFCFSWEVANFWQMLAFSMSTMVTLGFSNINVAVTDGIPHTLGMIVVSLNLMVGYFMLAVLVTRLAILFQTMGPGYVPPRKKTGRDKKPDTKTATSPSD